MLSCFTFVLPCATLGTIAHQAPLSKGFSKQEYCSGSPCSPPGDLPNLGIKPKSPALTGMFFTTSATGGAHREPVVKVGGAPGARPGRGEAGRRGSGTGSWRGWGAVPVVLRGSPLRLGRHREHGRGAPRHPPG